MHHQGIGLTHATVRLDPHRRGRHIIAGGLFRPCLHVQIAHDGVMDLVEGQVADGGRRGIGMPAPAQLRTDAAYIDGIAAAAGHHLHPVFHAAHGKKHRELLHLHQPMGQIGKIPQVVFHGGLGDDHRLIVDMVDARRFQQAVEGPHMQAGQLMGRHLVDGVDIHALGQQPGRTFKIQRRGGTVGERARVPVDAEPQQGSIHGFQHDPPLPQLPHQQGRDRAHGLHMARLGRDILGRGRMMVPDLNGHPFPVQQGRHMPDTLPLARIHQHEMRDLVPGDVGTFGQMVAFGIQRGHDLLQAALLRPGEQQQTAGVEEVGSQHGRKGIEIGIGMAGDQDPGRRCGHYD